MHPREPSIRLSNLYPPSIVPRTASFSTYLSTYLPTYLRRDLDPRALSKFSTGGSGRRELALARPYNAMNTPRPKFSVRPLVHSLARSFVRSFVRSFRRVRTSRPDKKRFMRRAIKWKRWWCRARILSTQSRVEDVT